MGWLRLIQGIATNWLSVTCVFIITDLLHDSENHEIWHEKHPVKKTYSMECFFKTLPNLQDLEKYPLLCIKTCFFY